MVVVLRVGVADLGILTEDGSGSISSIAPHIYQAYPRKAMLRWLFNYFTHSLRERLEALQTEHRSLAIELSRSEQSTLDLRNENDRLREEIANRPTRETVDLLKTQVDHLALRYERRQVYGTLGPAPIPTAPPADSTAVHPLPFSTNRVREFVQGHNATLRDEIAKEFQQHMGMQSPASPVAEEEKAAS